MLLVMGMVYTSASAQDLNPSLVPFKKLLGEWVSKNENGELLEVWNLKDHSSLLGKSCRIGPGGDSTLLETVILKADTSGIFCIPTVTDQNNGKAVIFKLVSASNSTFVSENKKHDFPQRVVYQLRDPDRLVAWIEGKQDGKNLKSGFHYRKVGD